MPRERILGEGDHRITPRLEVNWSPDRYVNLGVVGPSPWTEPEADPAPAVSSEQPPPTPRELLLTDLPDDARTILDSIEREHGEVLGDALVELLVVYGDHVRAQGLYLTLDRQGCQRAVKVIRRARNQVFGADE